MYIAYNILYNFPCIKFYFFEWFITCFAIKTWMFHLFHFCTSLWPTHLLLIVNDIRLTYYLPHLLTLWNGIKIKRHPTEKGNSATLSANVKLPHGGYAAIRDTCSFPFNIRAFNECSYSTSDGLKSGRVLVTEHVGEFS